MLYLEWLGDELRKIKDDTIRDFVVAGLIKAPNHFWFRSSSSSGKYHLKDEFIEGGLIKHTKRVCLAAEILMRASTSSVNQDVVIAACILHDICKYGDGIIGTEHTVDNHPQLASKLLREIPTQCSSKELIINAVERHMGKWGSNKPVSVEDRVVHLADMIATNYIP